MKATRHDNRGRDDEEPYGYVYFDDGARCGYTPGLALRPPVWKFNDPYWSECTDEHVTVATVYLVEQGVLQPATATE